MIIEVDMITESEESRGSLPEQCRIPRPELLD